MTVSTDAFYNDIAALTDFANSDNPLITIWQSFTATTTDYLYGVQLYGKTPDTVIGGQPINAVGINITIYNGPNPTFPVFTQLTATNVNSQPAGWISFVFPSPFTALVNGNQYTIEVGGPGAENFLWGYAFVSATTGYAGGAASFQPPSNLFFIVQKIPIPDNPNIPNTFTTLEVGDGSAAAPSYTFTSDTTTGLYHPLGAVGISVAGTTALLVSATEIRPITDNTYNIGDVTTRIGNLYLGNGAGQSTFFNVLTAADLPTIRATGVDPVVTYTLQLGVVIKIGTIYFISGWVEWSSLVGGAGNAFIESTISITPSVTAVINILADNVAYPAGSTLTSIVNIGTNPIRLNLVYNTSSAPVTSLPIGSLPAGAGRIQYTGMITVQPVGGP